MGPWDRASAAQIVASLPQIPTWSHPLSRDDRPRQKAALAVLEWLSTFAGGGWQARWEAAAVHDASWIDRVIDAFPGRANCRRMVLVGAMNGLLLRQVMAPSYRFLERYRANQLFVQVAAVIAPQAFARIERAVSQTKMTPAQTSQAMTAIAKMVLHTGRAPDELTQHDILQFRAEGLAARGAGHPQPARGSHAAWDLLRAAGIITGHQHLVEAVRGGQRSTGELVDRYHLRCGDVRDVLVRYLEERRPALDYATFRPLVATLAGRFWADLEAHHPDIDSLHLADDVAQAWKQRLSRVVTRRGEAKRTDYIEHLLRVRAFYLDLAQWALEDPSWARWAVPCPIRAADTFGIFHKRRAVVAKMHQHVRELLPQLSTLTDTADTYRTDQAQLLATATATAVGDSFTHVGLTYQRAGYTSSPATNGHTPTPDILAVNPATGERINLTRREDEAFWAWAVIETLRHTGVRIEEMLEITQLALVSYRLVDTGEIVPLLQIVPSKTDSERLLLVSPELAHVLASIISRLRAAGNGAVALVRRYDSHELITGPALPHLFQRRRGFRNEVITRTTAQKLLNMTMARAGLTDATGAPLHCTPHDFRRMFATDAVTGGLPVHIAARLLGHQNLSTTQAYIAVFQDDLVRTYRAFLDQRRATRPTAEYREPTDPEWQAFEQHFALRKLELGSCARPYGTPCKHEHACIRCPMLRMDPRQRARLAEIIRSLGERIGEARANGWLGEVQGLQTSLDAAVVKLAALDRQPGLSKAIPLGLPLLSGDQR